MNINEAIEFIQEADWKGSVLGLERTRELLHLLGDPQDKLKFIHVAGTNGKGSVCAMLASILKEAGYTTGLCISPHLLKYNERMQVNGRDITDDELCQVAEEVRDVLGRMSDVPTEFERVLAMCFLFFLKKKCDIVVLEVGLGGRIDATNIIKPPLLSIITHIALDHTAILGDSIPVIAREKAGIIKTGSKVLISSQSREAMEVIEGVCREAAVPFMSTDLSSHRITKVDLEGQEFDYRDRKGLKLSLIGSYQKINAAVAIDAVDILKKEGYNITDEALRAGLKKTRWPGRFELLSREPTVIADGAHNPDGAQQLAESIREFLPGRKITFVMSVMADKDYSYMIGLMAPFAKGFVAVAPDYGRALPAKELEKVIREETGLPVISYDTVTLGMEAALKNAAPTDTIVAFGSLYQMGEVRSFFQI